MKQKSFVLGLFGTGLHTTQLHTAIMQQLMEEYPGVVGPTLVKPAKAIFTTLALKNTVPTEELIFTPGEKGGNLLYFVGSNEAEVEFLARLYDTGVKEHPKRFPSALELKALQSLEIEFNDKRLELRYCLIKPSPTINNFNYIAYGRKK